MPSKPRDIPTDHAATVATAARAVEEAWEDQRIYHGVCGCQVAREVSAWLAARRAAREAGFVEVLVSKEAVAV